MSAGFLVARLPFVYIHFFALVVSAIYIHTACKSFHTFHKGDISFSRGMLFIF